MIRIGWRPEKEATNIARHGFDFSLSEAILNDTDVTIVYDRYEGGEHRWHAFALIGQTVLLLVHTYPDEDDDPDFVWIIGLRKATPAERKRYEQERWPHHEN